MLSPLWIQARPRNGARCECVAELNTGPELWTRTIARNDRWRGVREARLRQQRSGWHDGGAHEQRRGFEKLAAVIAVLVVHGHVRWPTVLRGGNESVTMQYDLTMASGSVSMLRDVKRYLQGE